MHVTQEILRRFRRHESGQVAVFFALLALPLIAVTSASIDYTNTTREENAIKGALDAAVIAAVNNNALTADAKSEFAKTHFRANYDGDVILTLTPTVEEKFVNLLAEGEIKLFFGQLIGLKNPKVAERSGAKIASENTICVLALSEKDKDAIKFDGDVTYLSPTCSVHANSKSSEALVSQSSTVPRAKSFCAVGGAKGDFLPYAKGECATIADPYAKTPAPFIGLCLTEDAALEDKSGTGKEKKGNTDDDDDDNDSANTSRMSGVVGYVKEPETGALQPISQNFTGNHVFLSPGTYCGGLTVDGFDVDFLPGEYIFKDGPLTFRNGAEAVARDVTFVMVGADSEFNVESGANVFIKAPLVGVRKGLAVMEIEDLSAPGNRKKKELKSRIQSGGQLSVLGTIYLPTHKLEIKGDGTQVGSRAPATSFIANKIKIKGENNAIVEIDIDHASAGVPPLLPRAEDGARLVR